MGPAGIDPTTLFLARDLAEVGDCSPTDRLLYRIRVNCGNCVASHIY